MKQNTLIIGLILLLVVGGVSFGAGYKVSDAKKSNSTGFTRGGNGNGQFGTLRNGTPGSAMVRGGNRQTIGEVISLDDKTMTVKMLDGSSKIVLLSSTMTINRLADAAKSDLKVGSKVAVFGATNSDGSQTATQIELDPRMPNLTPGSQR